MKKPLITISFIVLAFTTYCQPNKGNPASAPTPFGFVEFLVAAGAVLGGTKLHKAKKKAEK